MDALYDNFLAALPLFLLIGLGYFTVYVGVLKVEHGIALSKFSFTVTLPMLLFNLMREMHKMPPIHWSVTLAFYCGCLTVFLFGFLVWRRSFKLSGDSGVVAAMGGIFSNNVQLGIPMVVSLLGASAVAHIAAIISLNDFVMWTFATLLIECIRNRKANPLQSVAAGTVKTVKNPIVLAIILGALASFFRVELPAPVEKSVVLLANSASPVALFAVGVGLAQYSIKEHFRLAAAIAGTKLFIQPAAVFFFCLVFSLSIEETRAVCVLACMPVAVNMYIMAQEFKVTQAAMTNALLISTVLSALTVPIAQSLIGLFY